MKTCEHCGQPYEKRRNEAPSNLQVVTAAEHGLRHTIHATTKPCAICGQVFTPHKTKRVRAQTCGPECKSRLLFNPQRRAEGVMNVPAQAAAATRMWLAYHRQGAAA